MKKITTLLLLTVVSILFIGCSDGTKRNADFLPLLKINISDDIKGDAELVEVIQTSEKAMNEFSDNIEKLVIDGKDILTKKDEEQTLMDGLKAGKLMVQFVSNSTQMAKLIEEFDTYKSTKKEQGILNDSQLKALEEVGMAFNKRMNEINEKYKNYFDK